MEKKVLFAALLSSFFLCGCLAPKALDGERINIESLTFHPSGILEFSGSYDDGAWGLTGVRGRIDGEAIKLDGTAEFWGGEDEFAHRIVVPSRIKEVSFGSKVIWRREEKKAELPEKNIAENAVEKEPEKEVEKEPEKMVDKLAAEGNTDNDLPEVEPDDPDADRKENAPELAYTTLKIGGTGAFAMKVEWLSFEYIFWGASAGKKLPAETQVKHLAKFNAAEVNRYQNLETLEIKGTAYEKIDFTGLSLPKLKKLVIDNGAAVGLETVELPSLEEFYLNDTRTVPLGKVALPPSLPKLHTAGIQAFAGNFDFNSLIGKPVERLKINGDCFNFAFLKSLPLKELKFSGFTAGKGELDVLRALPLKKLKLHPLRPLADWSFLSVLKLEHLDLQVASASNFSPALLKNMPLKSLRIMSSSPANWDEDWELCRQLPLDELILCNARIPAKFLMGSGVKKLALFHCAWHISDPFTLLNDLPELRHLAVWRIVQYQDDKPLQMLDSQLDWGKFTGRRLESLCISGYDINFLQQLPEVKRFGILESDKGQIRMSKLRDRDFEILNLPQFVDNRHPSVKGKAAANGLTADW